MTRHLGMDAEAIDLDMLADALQDQESYDHWWTFDPRTGETAFWSRGTWTTT